MRKSRDYNEELPEECVLGEMEWCQCVCISGRSEYHIMILLQLWVSVFGWLITMKLIARLPPSVSPFCSICRFFISFQLSLHISRSPATHAGGHQLFKAVHVAAPTRCHLVLMFRLRLWWQAREKVGCSWSYLLFSCHFSSCFFLFLKKKWWSPFCKLCFQIPYPKKSMLLYFSNLDPSSD